jgi:tetratricopeptide (TPR) repeat protein
VNMKKNNIRKTYVAIFTLFVTTTSCATRGHDLSKNLIEGNNAALRGDYSSAVALYEAALEAVPNSAAAKRNLGIVLVKVGNYQRARQLLLEVAETYKGDVEIHYYLGETSRGLEDFQSASTHYQKALRQDPGDLRVRKALAWTWYKLKLHERSLLIVDSLMRTHPDDLQLRLIGAHNYIKQKKFTKAKELLAVVEQAGFKVKSSDRVSADSERALLMSALADAYQGTNDCIKANNLYQDVLKTRPFLPSALTGSAKCDMQTGNTQKAVSKLERAIKADPNMGEAHYMLGKIYETKDAAKATFYYRRFLLLTKNNSEYSVETKATKNALLTLEKQGIGR